MVFLVRRHVMVVVQRTAQNCVVIGNFSGQYNSGIFGRMAGYNGGSVTATNCAFTGGISNHYSSGIFGQQAGYNGGSVTATDCEGKW